MSLGVPGRQQGQSAHVAIGDLCWPLTSRSAVSSPRQSSGLCRNPWRGSSRHHRAFSRDPRHLGKPHPRRLGAASEFPQETVGMQQKMQSCLLPAQQMQFLLIHPSPRREFKVSAHSSGSSALKFTAPAPRHPQELPQHQALGQEYLGSGRKREVQREKSRKGLGERRKPHSNGFNSMCQNGAAQLCPRR